MPTLRLGLFLPTLEGWLGDAWLPPNDQVYVKMPRDARDRT
jgi:hypothetical protein